MSVSPIVYAGLTEDEKFLVRKDKKYYRMADFRPIKNHPKYGIHRDSTICKFFIKGGAKRFQILPISNVNGDNYVSLGGELISVKRIYVNNYGFACEFNDIMVSTEIESGIDSSMIMSTTRKKEVVLARQVVYLLAYKYTGLTYEEIGRKINEREHATVLAAINRLKKLLNVNDPLATYLYYRVKERLISG